MVQKCLYCKCDLTDDRPLTVCDRCGVGVWGEAMFKAIKGNMTDARDKGDLLFTEKTQDPPKMKELI